MYESGNKYDYEQRLHQMPTSSGDLAQFFAERATYTGMPFSYTNKWDKEEEKKKLIFSYWP